MNIFVRQTSRDKYAGICHIKERRMGTSHKKKQSQKMK